MKYREPEIIIPELESAPEYHTRCHSWTERDVAILKKYWGKKADANVAKALNRSVGACRVKYLELKHEGKA